MKKFIRAITSGGALTFLAVILELIISIALIFAFEQLLAVIPITIAGTNISAIIITVLKYILAFILIVRLTVRDIAPDTKLPWITILVFAPFAGILLYLLFSRYVPTKKRRRLAEEISKHSMNYSISGDDCADKLDYFYGDSRYLYNYSNAVPHRNCKTTFFSSGETFVSDYLNELKNAKKYILLEYFIIERGEFFDSILEILKQKVAEGVKIKMMYDDIGCISHIERGFCKQMNDLGIECKIFSKFTPIISAVHNNRDHRKMTIIDGRVCYTGGLNLADEYVNYTSPLGRWKDSVLKIEGSAVRNMIVLFLDLFQEQTPNYIEDYSEYFPSYYEKFENDSVVQPFGHGPRPKYKNIIGEDTILNMIEKASNYMYISTPYLIIDYNLTNSLCRAAKRGVDVRIITPHIYDKKIVSWITKRSYKKLINEGVKIYEYLPGFIHAKNYLCDGKTGMVATINMDYRSLIHHYECGVWMHNAECLKDIKKDFDITFGECQRMTKETAKMSLPKRFISAIGSIFSPLL